MLRGIGSSSPYNLCRMPLAPQTNALWTDRTAVEPAVAQRGIPYPSSQSHCSVSVSLQRCFQSKLLEFPISLLMLWANVEELLSTFWRPDSSQMKGSA